MTKNLYIFCGIIFIISYALMSHNQYNNYYIKKLVKKFNTIKLNDDDDKKIKILYNLILLFIIFLITVIFIIQSYTFGHIPLYQKYFLYNIIYHNHEAIYRISIAILFFLLGLFLSFGKKLIKSLINNLVNFTKTLIITGNYIVLLQLLNYVSSKIIILIIVIYLLCIINYFKYFQQIKDKMDGKEFILNFIWLLWICFSNSFILLYQIINK